MTHKINYDPETSIIEVKVEGNITLNEMKGIFAEAVRIGMENDSFLFLSDFREATINLSVSEIYNLPRILATIAAPMGVSASRFRRAIIFSPKNFSDARFAENVTANQGQNAKFFQDVDEARKWLSEK